MSKIGLILEREYLSRVKKKSFLLTTIGVPLIVMAFYAVIFYIGFNSKSGSKQHVAVIDNAGVYSDSVFRPGAKFTFKLIPGNEPESSFVKKYEKEGYDALLYIPAMNLDSPKNIVLHTGANASIATMESVEQIANKAIQLKRMQAKGIDPGLYRSIQSEVAVKNRVDSGDGKSTNNSGLAYIISLACGMLIYFMMIIYGTQVMRGVSEEKINRISEVVASSTKPFDLMMGKVIGIGLVGLTQFAIWIAIALLAGNLVPMFFHANTAELQTASASNNAISEILNGFQALPVAKIVGLFIFYFIFGYLTYASIFAAIGSTISDDQNEAQSLIFPVMMPIILGFVIMMQAVNDPNTPLAVFGSLFPLTSPVVMMGRITYAVPAWQIILSMVLLIATFILLVWIAAKIYRTGILMYGKKPSWKEMFRWAFKRN